MPFPIAALEAHPKRNLLFLSNASLWPHWPFLPLIRRHPDKEEEFGVLFDALNACDLPGYSATIFLTTLFEVPRQLDALLALPKEVFDTPDEIEAAGWRVD